MVSAERSPTRVRSRTRSSFDANKETCWESKESLLKGSKRVEEEDDKEGDDE